MTVQIIIAPDGTELVVLPREQFDHLIAAAEEQLDTREAEMVIASPDDDGMMPDQVMGLMLEGKTPVEAWRTYRHMSQSELAMRAGLSRDDVSRMEEAGRGAGHGGTRRRLAEALDAPEWTLSPDGGDHA